MTRTFTESAAPGFKANFTHTYQVTLSRPISDVFRIIGTSEGAERVTRLSKLAFTFDLLETDRVSVPKSASLANLHVRKLPGSEAKEQDDLKTRSLPRQFFQFSEAVPILGITNYNVHLSGTLTWDEEARMALYETRSHTGILVWKLRRFEALDGNTTRVTETIKGTCPRYLKSIVQKTTSKGHTAHMDSYHTLFE